MHWREHHAPERERTVNKGRQLAAQRNVAYSGHQRRHTKPFPATNQNVFTPALNACTLGRLEVDHNKGEVQGER